MSNLQQRIITATVLLILITAAVLLLDTLWLAVLLMPLVLLATWEWSAFVDLSLRHKVIYLLLILLMMMLFSGSRVFLMASCLWWIFCLLWLPFFPDKTRKLFSSKLFILLGGVFTLVPCWVALVAVRSQGVAFLLILFVMVWLADIGAYFSGRKFGKHKLMPKVSPGKTWEGALGGVLLSLLTVAVMWFFAVDKHFAGFMFFSLMAVSFSIVGDLTVSTFKRNVGLKDSGMIFPGHGGILDRIDSLTAAAPFFAIFYVVYQ